MTDPVQFSIDQFTNAWRLMCGASARQASASGDNLELVFSGLPIAFFNIGFVTGRGLSAGAVAATAGRACAWARTRGVPWLFVVTHEVLNDGVDAVTTLEACGFAPLMPLTGMMAATVAPPRSVPPGLELASPADDDACAALVTINAKAYGMDLAPAREVLGTRRFWERQFPVVGSIDGAPASCAAVMMVDGHRYVALVATDPGQQRRGYAEAAMRRALADAAAAHGERPTVLHATEAGRPVYERMGYRPIANHTVFMEKRFLTEH